MGCKLIICGRSVGWWDEELRQLIRDHRDCFAKGLNKDNNWNEYLRIRKELKQKIWEKRKLCKPEFMANVNSNQKIQ